MKFLYQKSTLTNRLTSLVKSIKSNTCFRLENISSSSRHLTIDLKSLKVPPNSTVDIPIHFHPLTLGVHNINCMFLVDSRKYPVKISGEALKICLQLGHPQDKYIELGKMHVGSVTRRVVDLINRTPTSLRVFLNIWENLPSIKNPPNEVERDITVPETIEVYVIVVIH